ncbi:hypothetical protein AVEN_194605-1 [Araneus ventricosus]|uniref:Uncharacterized protein n=1 Tax=Araneus ventricosus TaxID=182803 RepID=A0A4Y2A867_ARAVE|nr:hypothetical protein AVEN_194605-1 [Araneus ventricosus]
MRCRPYLHKNTERMTCEADQALAVFRSGVRGARLVPREFRGPQNLFGLHRCAKTTTIFRHWLGVGVLKAIFSLWPGIDKIRHCDQEGIEEDQVDALPILHQHCYVCVEMLYFLCTKD